MARSKVTTAPPRQHRRAGAIVALVLAAGLSFAVPLTRPAQAEIDATKLPAPAGRQIDFEKDVLPIFSASCHGCHGPEKQKSSFRLDSKSIALAGGDLGKAIIPGDSAASPLVHYISGLDPHLKMPAEGDPLTPEQVGIIRAWIDQGADWPASADVKVDDGRDHWSYQPLFKHELPAVKDAAWVRTPVDAFILATLEAKNLSPSEPADKRTLLRRAYFDLIGLPPTPEQIDAFLADTSPDAYEKVIDQLLASPRYGERWARHWMDVVHFAETHGNDQDRERKNAWPYRDYLIRAFNEDKPYARFIEDQLAADVLYPDDPQAIPALGFISAGPWDESSQMSIVDDTLDKKVAKDLDRDDMLTTTMQSFAATTINCARCHNHKFDPISQVEYFNLQSVFAGMDRADREYNADPQVQQARLALTARKAELEGPRETLAAMLLSSEAQAEAAAWEQSLAASTTSWTVLDPSSFVSGGGAHAAKQADSSILFSGPMPEKDAYTVVADTALPTITGVRIEVLTDESFTNNGPGRQPENGNLHLSEFRLIASPAAGADEPRSIAIRSATADFDQAGWTAAHAIDGNPGTAWGVFPEVGKPHEIIFEFAEPLAGFEGGTKLTFGIDQVHGGGHVIGRLRVSATASPAPLVASPVPAPVQAILQTPAAGRTDEQRADLALHVLKLKVEEQLAALPPPQMVFVGTTEFKPDGNFLPARGPRPVFVLKRGDVSQPMQPAMPGAMSCVSGMDPNFNLPDPNDEGTRRAALAKWLSDPKNGLVWRTIANRVWHYHFGRGIVDTPNDLGRMGGPPTHPELLDWLALYLIENNGSLKKLHRLIMTSNVYRQSSKHNEEYAKVDAANTLLWRMNRSRLDAESVRDAVLVVTDLLDETMGGPSVKQFIETPGIHVTTNADYGGFDPDRPEYRRRSVYRFIFRTLPDPFMDAMDCADASQLTPIRNTSVTALQALAMLNNRFIVRYSEHFAARVEAMKPGDLPAQVDAAFQLALGRPATAEEAAALASYAEKHGMANACRLILNSNEFMFVN